MRAQPLMRKALDLALRQAGQAPEQRAARRLGPVSCSPGGKRVLFLAPRSWAVHVQWDAMVGRALAARGAAVSYLTCGGGRQACDRTHLYEGPPMPCGQCAGYTHRALDAHGHQWEPLAAPGTPPAEPGWPELDELDLAGLLAVSWRGLPIGSMVRVPVCWHLCTTDLEHDPLARTTLRRFLRSAAAIVEETEEALDRLQPDTVVLVNGLFLFEQVAAAICERRGVDVVTYERGFVKDTVFFHRGESASRYDTAALWDEYRHKPLTVEQDEELDAYLADRRVGGRSVNDFWPAPKFEEAQAGFTLMLTNVTWDTAAQGRERCFDSPRQWILETVRWFAARPDLRLVVRAHPAEVRVPKARSREPVVDLIGREIPDLPPHVRLIGPEDPTSSYPLMEAADVALVYSSTAGMEAALAGTPCVTAATTQYASKGFTVDPPDHGGYFDHLEKVLADPRGFAPDVTLARRYAHFFFFRASFSSARWVREPIAGLARITDDRSVLEPGGDPDLDAICDGILHNTPFVRPEPEK